MVKECKLASQLYSDYGQVKKLTWKTLSKPTELLAIGRVANTPMLQLAKFLLQIFCKCNFFKLVRLRLVFLVFVTVFVWAILAMRAD